MTSTWHFAGAFGALLVVGMACSASSETSGSSGSSQVSDDDGTGAGSVASSGSPAASGTGAGGAGGQGAGGHAAGGCPTVDLGSAVPLSYDGSTVGRPNIAESQRLEWQTAGDDALLFTAPETGTYHIAMPSEPSRNDGCGASVSEYDGTVYDPSWCPAPAAVATLDGVYAAGEGIASDIDLTAGQELLLWVSCAYWSNPLEGAYTLTIDKL
jgi:hypothetical protein